MGPPRRRAALAIAAARALGLAGAILAALAGAGARQAAAGPLQIEVQRPGGFVFAAAEDGDGYVWFGTKLGLARFDGARHVTFDGASAPALPEARVVALVRGPDGALLAGHQHGSITRVLPGRFEPLAREVGPPGARLVALAFDARGTLWARTTLGLSRFEAGRFVHLPLPPEPPETQRLPLLPAPDGSVWAEIPGGWARARGDAVEMIRESGEARAARVLALFGGPGGASVDAARLGGRRLRTALVDRRGRLWLGTTTGLLLSDGGRVVALGPADGLPDENVRALAEDREGNVWVVTHGGGVARVSTRAVHGLTRVDGLRGNTPFAVAEAPDGALWVATTAGLERVHDGGLTHVPFGPSLPQAPRSLVATPDGALWMSTTARTLVRHRDGAAAEVPLPLPAAEEDVTALFATNDGAVLVGTSAGGLLRGGPGGFSPVRGGPAGPPRCAGPAPFGRPCPEAINALAPRRAGGVWVGTIGGKILSLDAAGRLAPLPEPRGAPPLARLFALHEDEAGALWIGCEGGLFRQDAAGRTRFGRRDGLPDENVYGILEDGRGHLWLGTERGLVRLSLAELARRARDGATPLSVARYGPPDVPSDETLGTWDPPALRLRDGRLVFTMTSGLAVVDRPGPAAAPLPVRIEEVLAGDRPAAPPLGGPLSLPAGGGPLELRFTAPAFAAPGRVRFFHALEGVDAGWVAAEGRRTARYTGLAPGTYTFRVRAESDDGARAPGEAAITLHLPPRWWQTLPFRALLVAATFGLAALAFRLREARARARFGLVLDERRRIARELHDSLAQVFTGLALQLDALARGAALPEGLRDRLDRLRATVTEGRRAARTAIWNLRADTGSSRALERALEELARQYEGANVAVTVEGTAAPLPLAAENELLLVAHQAVSNAVEHARARHIGVTLEYAPGRVALWVRDDGAGFAAAEAEGAEARGHFGLLGMRERAARAGGRLVVESSPGVGTEVGVVIDARERPAEEAP